MKTEKNTIQKIYRRSEENTNGIERLKLLHTYDESQLFSKKLIEFSLIDNYYIPTTSRFFQSFEFQGFPEWVLRTSQILEWYTISDGFEMNERMTSLSHWYWKQVGSTFILKYIGRASLTNVVTESPLSVIQVPLFLNLKLIVTNPNSNYEIQHNKV